MPRPGIKLTGELHQTGPLMEALQLSYTAAAILRNFC